MKRKKAKKAKTTKKKSFEKFAYDTLNSIIEFQKKLYGKVLILLLCLICYSACYSYTDAEIADAIYKAEGGAKAKKAFGILSVKCEGYNECRQVCLNTIRNNRKRYKEYGYKKYKTYLEFLASRYAPVGAENDPRGLNRNWLKNVKYFLK